MASSNDPNRPVVEPFTKEQRARLEALQFANRLVSTGSYQQDKNVDLEDRIVCLLRLADYIVIGDA